MSKDYSRRMRFVASHEPRNLAPAVRTELENWRQAVDRPAPDEFIAAIDAHETLLDQASALRIPGTKRIQFSATRWALAEARVAKARRRCARELGPEAAASLLATLEARRPCVDPIHLAAAREIAPRHGTGAPPKGPSHRE